MELISMTDFVLDQLGNEDKGGHMNYHDSLKVLNYAKFLKQPLKLEMFVPCDEEGNVMQKPNYEFRIKFFMTHNFFSDWQEYKKEYKKAQEKVLFEGFEKTKSISDSEEIPYVIKHREQMTIPFHYMNGKWNRGAGSKVIENLVNRNIELTPSAIKQIGL